jgi:Ca2+-binding RTX toxin-like protein
MATIRGTPDNDFLQGTVEGDTLEGLEGNDTLNGSAGNDSLKGGPNDDLQADFEIELSGVDFDLLASDLVGVL